MLAALLIVSLVFGLLLESVTTNLADLGRARREARSMQLSEQRARELEAELETGGALEDGASEGAYEEPDDDLRWHISVSTQTLDLPADYPGAQSPSPLFAVAGAAPTPRASGADAPPPPLRVVEVRVFEAGVDPNDVDPFVLLVTAPPDPARLAQLEQQRQQAVPQQPDGGAETPPQ